MRRLMVAGNWKMHGSQSMVRDLATGIQEQVSHLEDIEVAVFPPFVYLEQVQKILRAGLVTWGAQNVAAAEAGAYTGEVSAAMLADYGCMYVIIGHSERRQHFGETDKIIAKKFQLAQEAGLTPVLCIGESLEQRNAAQTFAVIEEQLNTILTLENCGDLLQNAVLAYEPVWAIGTGNTATPEQAQEVHAYIRNLVKKHTGTIAENLKILYGGSVKANNARALFAMPDIDGGLVGGASLSVNEFTEICRCSL